MSADYHLDASYARGRQRGVLGLLDLIGAKDAADAAAFRRLGVPADRVTVLGDLRFDPAFHLVPAAERDARRRRLGLGPADRVLVAGSVRPGEEGVVLDACARLRRDGSDLRLVVAPRFLSQAGPILRGCAERGLTARRATAGPSASASVVVLDTYGDLARVYALATYVLLGGSLVKTGLGLGQNLVEPLAHGAPVFFGPHMSRWQALTRELLDVYPGLEVRDAAGLVAGIDGLEAAPDRVAALREVAAGIMARGRNGVEEHVRAIERLVHARSVERV
jgi:3-deoxy-D-manno-octulosonic-acid transferase